MSSSLFSSSKNLRGQRFSYGLGRFDPIAIDQDEFIETPSLSVFIDEEGVVNISDKILLHSSEEDCIDTTTTPQFSKNNKLIKGLSKVLPGVPEGGAVALGEGNSIPQGWAKCDGRVYAREDGGLWIAPTIPDGFGGPGIVWIVRLPAGVG